MAFPTRRLAYFLLRIILGANFFLHGVLRLLAPHADFAAFMAQQMQHAPIPGSLVSFASWGIPITETGIGLALLIGLATPITALAGTLLMFALEVGTCLAQHWDSTVSQLIYVLLLLILLAFSENDIWCMYRISQKGNP